MDADGWCQQAWKDHATRADDVAARLPDALALVERPEQAASMARLVAHVFGEHLGRWDDGAAVLTRLHARPCVARGDVGDRAIAVALVALATASGARGATHDLSPSEHIRALATAACALVGQRDAERAQAVFAWARDLAASGLAADDPANRALAIAGNNLACELEERPSRTAAETALMLAAAATARTHWEIAGGWLEVERAEYRLAQSHLKAGDTARASAHAQACLDICRKNDAPAIELFFAHEALALVERARGDAAAFARAIAAMRERFAEVPDDEKRWCEEPLRKITAPLAAEPGGAAG